MLVSTNIYFGDCCHHPDSIYLFNTLADDATNACADVAPAPMDEGDNHAPSPRHAL
ncbi:hypothetical protein [Achromobacter ruhlandii]|uniref:hypothetical protein n=1 Tax=Achromobacter ruhlandii TaxID=72557 RepID=UPI000AC3E9B4|nr:hypothetical protein [Achromobacter ruhlandii]